MDKRTIKQLEKKFLNIRAVKGGSQIVVKRDEYGRWLNLEKRLLTKEEVDSINRERERFGKQLIILGCWEPVKELPKDMSRYGSNKDLSG